jgi:hypothetical protein
MFYDKKGCHFRAKSLAAGVLVLAKHFRTLVEAKKTMKSWINRIALVALLLAMAIPALADIPDPNTNTRKKMHGSKITTEMRIEPNEETKEAKLVIPRDVLRQLTAGIDDEDSQSAASSSRFFKPGSAQTLMAGLFLSLAFAFGGVWLVRSRVASGKLARAALGVTILALCGLTASIAYANAGPPEVARTLTSKILIQDLQWWGAYGQVKVEIVEEGDHITLVLPKQKEQPK